VDYSVLDELAEVVAGRSSVVAGTTFWLYQ
jgi:hypothetical protein